MRETVGGFLREACREPNSRPVRDSCKAFRLLIGPTRGPVMFNSICDLSERLRRTGYFIDPVMTQVVFLAIKLHKPLLLEGPAGSGKTQLPISIAEAAGTHVERLQCYRGVTEDKAIGRFDESLQRLYMDYAKGQVSPLSRSIREKSRSFISGPSLNQPSACRRRSHP